MAHSRLEKIGTIFTRVSGLIKSGAMKLEDRPLWYEIYQAFPPKYSPSYDRPVPDVTIKNIFYPEDVIRAKFYKHMKNVPSIHLSDNKRQSLCQKCISLTYDIKKEDNLELDEAFDKAINIMTGQTGTLNANNKLKAKSMTDMSSIMSDTSPTDKPVVHT